MINQDPVVLYDCDTCRAWNTELAEAILQLPEDAFNRRTHWFHGRYENLYVEVDLLPGLKEILEKCMEKAAEILKRKQKDLKLGFWLNIMRKGDVTTLHSHDDDDELLSAVYYVQANEQSALFRLHRKGKVEDIKPVAGRFMFFDPVLPHEVLAHDDDMPRISIGINFGPAQETI